MAKVRKGRERNAILVLLQKRERPVSHKSQVASTTAIECPSWDRFISDPVEESSTHLHLQSVIRRKEELDTIQMNNVTILEAGATWKVPSGVVPGTKCLFLDPVTNTFAFVEQLDGGGKIPIIY